MPGEQGTIRTWIVPAGNFTCRPRYNTTDSGSTEPNCSWTETVEMSPDVIRSRPAASLNRPPL